MHFVEVSQFYGAAQNPFRAFFTGKINIFFLLSFSNIMVKHLLNTEQSQIEENESWNIM